MDYKGKKLGVISLGCDKNRVDTEKLLGVLDGKIEITSDPDEANIVVINTCAFLQSAREESIENILDINAKRKKGKLEKIIVTGCLPQKFVGEMFDELTEADAFMGVSDYDKIFEVLDRIYGGERVNYVGDGKRETESKRIVTTPKSYAYLKIADGCDNFCTYCLIPKIRGRYRSVAMDKLIDEAKSLGEVAELILVAQDITRYGEDLYNRQTLPELIRELSKLENIKSIRLLYAYPDKLNDEIIEEIADNPKVIKYLDIPLQHASDEVLKRMNRKGSLAEYRLLIKKLRERVKGIAIRSTFITGFPDESRKDFKILCKFLKEQKLDNAGFFPYSREEDTPAYSMKNQIDEKIKQKRLTKLYFLQRKISHKKLKSYVGSKMKMTVDGFDEETGNYICRAYFSAPEIDTCALAKSDKSLSVGQVITVAVTATEDYDLFGEYCDEYT